MRTMTGSAFLALIAAIAISGCGKDNGIKEDESPEEEVAVDVAGPTSWALVDELGRSTPADVKPGSKRQGRTVAMFYWTWHQAGEGGNQCWNKRIVNISEVLKEHPEAMQDATFPADHPIWGQPGQGCFWGKPLLGYYRTTDPWVLRKHAEMLGDAGVDVVFFDCTNGAITWDESTEALLKSWTLARKDGVNVPEFAFLLPFSATDDSRTSIRKLYTRIYKTGRYKDLWYMLDGKPLIMAWPDNLTKDATDAEIKAFFTFRPGQPDYVNGPSRKDQWGWLEVYPQHVFGQDNEQMTVGVAQNTNAAHNGHCYAFNAPGAYGRSHTSAGDDCSEAAYVKGLNFQEQWDRALSVDPKVIWVTGWNEWIAGRQQNWPPNDPFKPFAFPDQFNSEYSRDIEPNAEWGDYGDIYYCQLVQNIRRYKGIDKTPAATERKSFAIGRFRGWKSVGPDYLCYPGNAFDRRHPDHSTPGTTLINTSCHNDFADARVARDDEYVYFFVKTVKPVTDKSTKGWMRLFINIDRDYATGWKGYDFCLNYEKPSSASEGIVSRCSGNGWKWTAAGTFEYAVKDNMMEVKLPRAVLGAKGALDFEFKWSDGMQVEGSILDFYVNGDCAPGERFNFVYKAG